MDGIKALTFDTGGTILDWHTGFRNSLAAAGETYGESRDWADMANQIRRAALKRMLNLGKDAAPSYNFDGAHRAAVDEVLAANEMDMLSDPERHWIAYDVPHNFKCWSDFPAVLPRLRRRFICASFTILSFRIIIDTARANGLSWDAVISCEAIGKYKPLPEAYLMAAHFLQLEPAQICMVACHNFDLDAAKAVGFKTAFVRRPDEWGSAGAPDPTPNPAHDIIVDDFPTLVAQLGA